MSVTCFECGDIGHIVADCPNREMASDGKSPWCGICDPLTRLTMTGDGRPGRCTGCHPLRHQHLKHLTRCPSCKMLVHQWDNAPCGRHSSPVAADRRLPIEEIHEIVGRPA